VWGRETFHFFKNSPPHTSLFGGNEIQFPFREKGYLSLERRDTISGTVSNFKSHSGSPRFGMKRSN
jgi:hypothetical protein